MGLALGRGHSAVFRARWEHQIPGWAFDAVAQPFAADFPLHRWVLPFPHPSSSAHHAQAAAASLRSLHLRDRHVSAPGHDGVPGRCLGFFRNARRPAHELGRELGGVVVGGDAVDRLVVLGVRRVLVPVLQVLQQLVHLLGVTFDVLCVLHLIT